MTFKSYYFQERIAGREVTVCVTPTALHALKGRHFSAHKARELVNANYELIEDAIARKFAQGDIIAGEIVICGTDLDP